MTKHIVPFIFSVVYIVAMAVFIIGKKLKDQRQNKAIEDLFDRADKNGNGRITIDEYVSIFQVRKITSFQSF